MFLFHNVELGEYLCASSLGLPDEPKNFFFKGSCGEKYLMLLMGQLKGAETSYFHGRWQGYAVRVTRSTRQKLAEDYCSVDITQLVTSSLRVIPCYADLVPNPNVRLPLPIQQRLLAAGNANLLRGEGDKQPIDSLVTVYALAGLAMPLSASTRKQGATRLVNALRLIHGRNRATASVLSWTEVQGEKLILKNGRQQLVENRVCEVCFEFEGEGARYAGVITLDAQRGTTLGELKVMLGLSDVPHLRPVKCLHWG